MQKIHTLKLPSSFLQAWEWHSNWCCGGVEVFFLWVTGVSALAFFN